MIDLHREILLTSVPPGVICRTCEHKMPDSETRGLTCKHKEAIHRGRVSSMIECPIGLWIRYTEWNYESDEYVVIDHNEEEKRGKK